MPVSRKRKAKTATQPSRKPKVRYQEVDIPTDHIILAKSWEEGFAASGWRSTLVHVEPADPSDSLVLGSLDALQSTKAVKQIIPAFHSLVTIGTTLASSQIIIALAAISTRVAERGSNTDKAWLLSNAAIAEPIYLHVNMDEPLFTSLSQTHRLTITSAEHEEYGTFSLTPGVLVNTMKLVSRAVASKATQ